MIENYRSGLLWRLMRQCPYLVSGLRRAGFTGGWLEMYDCGAALSTQCRPNPESVNASEALALNGLVVK
jgi:hypothetical protein